MHLICNRTNKNRLQNLKPGISQRTTGYVKNIFSINFKTNLLNNCNFTLVLHINLRFDKTDVQILDSIFVMNNYAGCKVDQDPPPPL